MKLESVLILAKRCRSATMHLDCKHICGAVFVHLSHLVLRNGSDGLLKTCWGLPTL